MEIHMYEIKCEAAHRSVQTVDIDVWNFVRRINQHLPENLQLRGEEYFVNAEDVSEDNAQKNVTKYSTLWTYQIGDFSNYSNDQIFNFTRPNCVTLVLDCCVDMDTCTVINGLYHISFHFKGNFPGDSQVVIREKEIVSSEASSFFDSVTASLLINAILEEYSLTAAL